MMGKTILALEEDGGFRGGRCFFLVPLCRDGDVGDVKVLVSASWPSLLVNEPGGKKPFNILFSIAEEYIC